MSTSARPVRRPEEQKARRARRAPVPVVVAVTVAVAVAVDVALYTIGRALGGTFRFTAATGPVEVDAVTVAGFAAVPLLVGLVVAALLSLRWPGVLRVAMVVAPVLALVTVPLMTLSVDLDTVSTVTLAACHVVLAPLSVLALAAIGRSRSGA